MPGKIELQCPVPLDGDRVTLVHGGGGRAMHRLLESVFLPAFGDGARHDGATVEGFAFSTDSYVVRPLFFPGGDIGSLAVYGTANDLAMCGAEPVAFSAGFIVEEGFAINDLKRVVASMREAARVCGAAIVTGDTKVVERGKADSLFINTAGIGRVRSAGPVCPSEVMAGDAVLISGDIARHGMAILSAREGLELDGLESDCGPLWPAVKAMIEAGIQIHCLRDLTRGGLASALNEIAGTSGLGIRIRERDVPVAGTVRAACELLGLDPMHMACEGRFVTFVPERDADRALKAMPAGARRIGEVGCSGRVTLETLLGTVRLLDMPEGDPLPRIC